MADWQANSAEFSTNAMGGQRTEPRQAAHNKRNLPPMKALKFDLSTIDWVAQAASPADLGATPVVAHASGPVLDLEGIAWAAEVHPGILNALGQRHLVARAPQEVLDALYSKCSSFQMDPTPKNPYAIVVELPESDIDRLRKIVEQSAAYDPGSTIDPVKQDPVRITGRGAIDSVTQEPLQMVATGESTLDPVKQINNPDVFDFISSGSLSTIHLVAQPKRF